MVKKLLSLVLVTLFIAINSLSVCAASASISINEQVETLLALKLQYAMEGNVEAVANVETQLERLGAEKMSTSEVIEKFGDSGVASPMVTEPIDTNSLDWHSTRLKVTRGGITYEVQSLYVQPNVEYLEPSALLHECSKEIKIQSAGGLVTGFEIFKVIGNAAASYIPLVSEAFTFYDIYKTINENLSTTSRVNNVEISYDYSVYQTVCFQYVKIDGHSDSEQELRHISSRATVGSVTTSRYGELVNGVAYPRFDSVVTPSVMIRPANFANTIVAVDAYIGSYTARTDLGLIEVKGAEDQVITNVQPICPNFPAHVV